ncbi:hypothetical protein BGX34_001427 [Mortierella sp. NVP85]|nr:hypothetical protein BGX34_001427 [Mortierella sp. NVP85]
MVSKIVGLSLLVALASTVNAYTWLVHYAYDDSASPRYFKWKVHPVDVQIPGNDALVWTYESGAPPSFNPPFGQYGYGIVNVVLVSPSVRELAQLYVIGSNPAIDFPCTKIEEFVKLGQPGPNNTILNLTNKGTPAFPTTTPPVPTTTTCPVVTVTVPVTPTTTNPPPTTTTPPQSTTTPPQSTTTPPKPTTSPPKPSPTCLAGYKGKKNGKGLDGACCSSSDDCRDTCVQDICRDRCLTGYEGKKNGKGPNGACCSHSDDCKDTCVYGICKVHP